MKTHMKKYWVLLMLFLGFGFWGTQACAQSCEVESQIVFKLRDPAVVAYNLWDEVYGLREYDEIFSHAVEAENGRTFLAGLRARMEERARDLIIVEVDKRGRLQFDKIHNIEGLRKVVEIIPRDDGYMVMGNVRKQGEKSYIWLGFFDKTGVLFSQKDIRLTGASVYAKDIVSALDGDGFVLAASAERRLGEIGLYSIIYRISSDGEVLQDRAYYPGLVNEIRSIDRLGDHDYIAAGYIQTDDNSKAGWMMRLNKKAGIVWQKQYTRGTKSEFTRVKHYKGEMFIVTGLSTPYGSEAAAAWTMLVEGFNGENMWQRFYRDEFDLIGQDVLVHEDGRVSLLMNAIQPPGKQDQNYVRLLTLSPRGGDPQF